MYFVDILYLGETYRYVVKIETLDLKIQSSVREHQTTKQRIDPRWNDPRQLVKPTSKELQ